MFFGEYRKAVDPVISKYFNSNNRRSSIYQTNIIYFRVYSNGAGLFISS
jgi:hypothetical protein